MKLVLAALALAALLAPPLAAQWETSQGGDSRRSGFVATRGPLLPRPDWSVEQPTQFALQPVVGEGLVVYTRVFDWRSPMGAEIEAVDLDTGALRWKTTLPPFVGLYSAPVAIRDGKVYARRAHWALVDEFLYALDAATGAILWRSQDLIQPHFFSSPAFLPGGDMILNGEYVPGLGYWLLRLDHDDGRTVWSQPPSAGTNPELAGGAVFGDRFYMVHWLPGRHELARIDPDTGLKLYSRVEGEFDSESHGNLMIGPDGTLYWPYGSDATGGAELIALTDTGSSLVEKWRVPMRELWASSLAVRPDGSPYSLSKAGEVVRLDPDDGRVLARSAPLAIDFIQARLTLDAEERLYAVFQGLGATPAELHAFDADLGELWSVDLGVSPSAGPTLARDGRLIVSTAAKVVRTFRLAHVLPVEENCPQPAGVTFRNGGGTNAALFRTLTPPRLGHVWRSEVDASTRPAARWIGAAVHARPATGIFEPGGELLVDPSSPRLFLKLAPAGGGPIALGIRLPADSSLCGRSLTAQGFLLYLSRIELTNALELRLGH